MTPIYSYKNVFLLVLLFLMEGGLFNNNIKLTEGYALECNAMTTIGISTTEYATSMLSSDASPSSEEALGELSSQLEYGDIYVHLSDTGDLSSHLEYGDIYVHLSDTGENYIITWDEWKMCTDESTYIIKQSEYDAEQGNLNIAVCPTVNNDDCSEDPTHIKQIIVHPVEDLEAEINGVKLVVSWNDDDINENYGTITYTIQYNDILYTTPNSSWEIDEVNGASRNVCVSVGVLESRDSSSWECKIAEKDNGGGDDNLGLIIGLSIGVSVILLIIIGIVIYKIKHPSSGSKKNSNDRISMDERNGQDNPQKSDDVLKSEFAKLKDINHNRSTDIAKRYKDKNHYIDVLPYDDTLVKLKKVDYMNASYILDGKFIVTPDPMPDQDNDIWQLIYECDVRVIIRISTAGEQRPMAQYIPAQTGDSWVMGGDEVDIKLVSSQQWDGYVENTLKLKKDDETRNIKHFHLTNWPEDQSSIQIQDNQAKVLGLIRLGRSFSKNNGNNPVLIHCGAGSGRTGAVAGIWHLMDLHDKKAMVNTYHCVSDMRKDRVWMVQKQEQYFFLYNCITEYQNNTDKYRTNDNDYGEYQ